MPAKRSEELGLFTIINGLDVGDLLHRQLISRKDVALADACSSFLRTDRGEAIKTEAIESSRCGHFSTGTGSSCCRGPHAPIQSPPS